MSKQIKPSKFSALKKQADRLQQVKCAEPTIKDCAGMKILVFPKVYAMSIDTELMIDTIEITPDETFLEIGCGTGAIAVSLAQRAKSGIAVDINQDAVKNTKKNAKALGIENLSIERSDIFEKVQGSFDVIACNPPYSQNEVSNDFERMFWDPNNKMKETFFREAKNFLNPKGKIYFGWADFADIDVDLPFKLAEKYGYEIVNTESRISTSGEFTFFVFQLRPKW